MKDFSQPAPAQREVLKLIAKSLRDRGVPPTIRELLAQTGCTSTNGMREHILALQRKGFIARDAMRARAIRITSQGQRVLGVRRREAELVRAAVLAEIERRSKAHAVLLGAVGGELYRTALNDLAGWLEGADVAELINAAPTGGTHG